MGMYGDALAKSLAMWRDPDSHDRKMAALFKAQDAYLDDPSISEHDKELQMALDRDVRDPMPDIERERKMYECFRRTGFFLEDDLLLIRGYESNEEFAAELAERISEESVRRRVAEYRRYSALREEAIRKGFVKNGCCKRHGGGS